MLLAGDIGGTKTHLALFSPTAGPRAPVAEATFASGTYAGLVPMIREFLASAGQPADTASLGVAGPVVAGRASITNLPWVVDADELKALLNLSAVHLLNDLEAIASAVPLLEPDELVTLNVGQAPVGGAMAVIAPGTGLGEAFLTWDGAGYRAHASEGGHADFAPTTPVEVELLRYLLARLDHVSYERVCSGRGLPNLYDFLRDTGAVAELPHLVARLAVASDPTPLIVEHGLDPIEPSPLCRAALDLFVAILGAEAGNLALKVLATGGVYLGGGLPPRLLPILTDGRFMVAFRRKGRFAPLLARVPVRVIRAPGVGLLGAARVGLAATS